jgi:opacity protein-like surface antigen
MKNGFRTALLSSFALAVLAGAGAASAESYWRVDSGYSKSRDADFKDTGPTFVTCGNAACTDTATFDNVGSSGILGLGWGYRFASWFRSDITFALRNAYRLEQSDRHTPSTTYDAGVRSKALLLNVYFDFPTRGTARPYIGLAGGVAENKMSQITGTNLNGVPDTTFTLPGGTKRAPAGALMVGFSVPLSDGGAVEFGARWISLGKLETQPGEQSVTTAGVTTFSNFDGGFTGRLRAFEWTVGVRF